MAEKLVLNGNHAAAHACKGARVQVIAAYPITPQSPATELLSQFVEKEELKANYVCVESEHSAMTVCIAASSTGARTFTATSANGLALMHEQLHWAAGARLPIVMACVNRAMAAPWNVWTDNQDSISQRDTGWMQLYCEDNQEIYDTILQAYKIAEQLYCPVMVCYDGYILSHTLMTVETIDQKAIDDFLPSFKPYVALDPDDPKVLNLVTFPWIRHDHPDIERFGGYPEIRYKLQQTLRSSFDVIQKVDEEFGEKFGRRYGFYKEHGCDEADYIMLAMGSLAAEATVAADILQEEGHNVGVLSLKLFRPFPSEILASYAQQSSASTFIVIDRNISYGYEGAVCTEFKAALYTHHVQKNVHGYLLGIGGRDVNVDQILEVAHKTIDAINKGQVDKKTEWINVMK
ncbi:MAG: pyruvate ferredoxin oxidoreductase [Candidatus Helarchaeota archaeon]|nr:pyruvate ferredoxin oxidoreductase [Candidatus Helarchaeota archaeon]